MLHLYDYGPRPDVKGYRFVQNHKAANLLTVMKYTNLRLLPQTSILYPREAVYAQVSTGCYVKLVDGGGVGCMSMLNHNFF